LPANVYYRCTKKVDPTCPERYINEKDLNIQLIAFIENNYEEIEVTDDLARRMHRHAQVVEHSLDTRGIEHGEIYPLPEYARYVLTC